MTEHLRNVFTQMDTDEDGLISRDEASFAVQLLGHKADVPVELFKRLDTNNDNMINFDEFVKLADLMPDVVPAQPIRRMSRQHSTTSGSSTGGRKISLFSDK